MEKNTANKKIEIISTPEQVSMADAWYEFATLDHFWVKARFNAVKRNLSPQSLVNNKFLEVGCGNGLVINQFENSFNLTVDGCDLNMFAMNQVGQTKGKLYCLNIYDKPPALLNRYDGVLLMDVIEHIDADNKFLEASLAYLKENGIVIINVPALQALFSKYDVAAGHQRRYSRKDLYKLFEENNVEVVEIRYWGFLLLPVAILRKFMLRFIPREKVIENGFKPGSSVVNKMLGWITNVELRLLKKPPIGTSVIAIGRKKINKSS